VKLGTYNFVCWLIHRSTSACMIYYHQNGCVQSHVTSLHFREISDNIGCQSTRHNDQLVTWVDLLILHSAWRVDHMGVTRCCYGITACLYNQNIVIHNSCGNDINRGTQKLQDWACREDLSSFSWCRTSRTRHWRTDFARYKLTNVNLAKQQKPTVTKLLSEWFLYGGVS